MLNTDECPSGHPDQVGYSDTPRSTGVAMGRAWARAWVVWGDMTQRQPRTCEWPCAVKKKRHSPQKTLNLPPRYLCDSSAWSHLNQLYSYPMLP